MGEAGVMQVVPDLLGPLGPVDVGTEDVMDIAEVDSNSLVLEHWVDYVEELARGLAGCRVGAEVEVVAVL